MTDQLPTPSDPLGNEISLRAQIDASGLNVGAKSRALSAIDRLVGTLVDNVGVGLEGRPKRIRAEHDAAVAEITARDSVKVLGVDYSEETLKKAAASLIIDHVRKFENREAIAAEAVLLLTDQSPGLTGEQVVQPEAEIAPPADDWMNLFADYADKASSAALRTLWAKVLAGEVRKPGAFSPATMRFIAEFDQLTARSFEAVAKSVIAGDFVPKISDDPNNDITELLRLEEVGLLTGATGMISKNIVFPPAGPVVFGSVSPKGEGALVILNGTPGQRLSISAVVLTRIGREILQILPEADLYAAALSFAESIPTSDVKGISVQKITKNEHGVATSSVVQVFPAPSSAGLPNATPQ